MPKSFGLRGRDLNFKNETNHNSFLLSLMAYCCFKVPIPGHLTESPFYNGGGRVVRRCWVIFQCRGVLLIWIIVGQGPVALAVGAGGGCLDIFLSYLSFLSSFSLSLGDGSI